MKSTILVIMFLIFSMATGICQNPEFAGFPVSPERSRDFDVLHNKISLSVDLAKKFLEGENTITLVPLRDDLRKIKLDAITLIATDVVNEKGKRLEFDQADETILINLEKVYGHKDTISVTVKYHLSEPVGGLRFIDAEGDRPLQVSSDCFPNKARQWIPCYDFPNDKATQDMIITTGSKYKVLSNGQLIDKYDNNDGTFTWHWRQDKPHSTYLINLSIADYLVVKDSLNELPVNYWVYKSMADDVDRVFGKTPYMIDMFNRIYNYKYPWDKYDQVISGYMGGGAEATSATLLGEGTVTDENADQDFKREKLIAHEIAHQWWGDLITLQSWEHTWLNESFGTYSDYLYTYYDLGKDAGDHDLLLKKNAYLREANQMFIRPIVYVDYEHPGENFNRHTYQKGACTLNLLRYILGDDTFLRVISTFLHRYEYQPVTTFDFMKCVKDVSGKNMDWFFEQYFLRPGHVVFNISKDWNESKKELTVTITQEQDKWENVPIYKIPVRLGIYKGDSREVKEFWLKDKKEIIIIPLESEPDMVRFDDGNYLIKEWTYRKSRKELIFQINKDDVPGRLWAVEQLSEYYNDPETINIWKRVAENDDFWAVRNRAIEMTGKYHGKNSIDLLKRCATDEKSKVRSVAVRVLGELKDPSLIDYYKQIFREETSYAVKAEALKAIGKCGNISDIPFLKEAGLEKSYRNVVGTAAQQGINFITDK